MTHSISEFSGNLKLLDSDRLRNAFERQADARRCLQMLYNLVTNADFSVGLVISCDILWLEMIRNCLDTIWVDMDEGYILNSTTFEQR